ncbi:MAG TPA: DUF2892 domain-containing protein [Patescibacteria group bacterium]|nr:DUF2892 domain-containing protein [Patescibacteria group bacterium]
MDFKNPLPKNLAPWDRALRVVLGAGMLGWWTYNGYQGVLWPILGVALLVNAAMGRCGAYALFGLSTCPIKKPPSP